MAVQVFATALELLGIDRPDSPSAVGHSLTPLMANDGQAPRNWPRFEAYFETIAPRVGHGWSQLTGWMKEDWRLIHAPRPELYDLDADPGELDNRFAEKSEVASGLFAELAGFLSRNETASVGESFQANDAQTVRRLEALGYVDETADAP